LAPPDAVVKKYTPPTLKPIYCVSATTLQNTVTTVIN
jgi:hypothetical protein